MTTSGGSKCFDKPQDRGKWKRMTRKFQVHIMPSFKNVLYFETFNMLLYLSCKQILKTAFEIRQITFFLIFQMPNKHQKIYIWTYVNEQWSERF